MLVPYGIFLVVLVGPLFYRCLWEFFFYLKKISQDVSVDVFTLDGTGNSRTSCGNTAKIRCCTG